MIVQIIESALISPSDVAKLLGVSKNTVKAIEERDATFPRRVKISARRVGYPVAEVSAWIAAR